MLASVLFWGLSGRKPHPQSSASESKREEAAPVASPAQNQPAPAPSKVTRAPLPPHPASPTHAAPASAAPPATTGNKGAPSPVHATGKEGDPKAVAAAREASPAAAEKHATSPSKEITLASLNVAPPPPKPPAAPEAETGPIVGRVAFVIDDFGQDIAVAKKFLQLPFPIALSVLPYQRHSREIAQLAYTEGRGVLVHLPMEPLDYPKANPGEGALLLSMSSEDVQAQLKAILDANPYASGVNNHMGSKFTEQESAMRPVLAEMERRKLFFLDSFTSANSVGFSLARQMRLPSCKRDVFLDHDMSESAMVAQFTRLIQKAKAQGAAVAIGHPFPLTLRLLKEQASRLRKEGIAIVPVKTLMSD